MRKITIALTLFFLTAFLFAEELKLLSLNMATRSRTAEQVAEMILDSEADIVFLQEIWLDSQKDAAAHKIRTYLSKNSGSKWLFFTTSAYALMSIVTIGEETYKSGGNGQNNAIFYNTAKVSGTNLADEVGFTDFGRNTENPAKNFLFDKNNVQIVKFSSVNKSEKSGQSDFIAMNIHLPFTDKAHRTRDLQTLERLYARYKQRYGVIIAGDFNYYRRNLTKRNFDYVDGTESWYYDPNFGLLTTMSTKGENEVVFASDYDHFIYSPKINVTEQMHRAFSSSNAKTVDKIIFGKLEFTNSIAYRKEISDHVPIVIKIDN